MQSRVQDVVRTFQTRFMGDDAGGVPDTEGGPARLEHAIYNVIADPDNRNAIIDAELMPEVLRGPTGPSFRIGLISHIEVNRRGGAFSCPIRSGAVLSCVYTGSGLSQAAEPTETAPESRKWFNGMAALESSTMTLLRNCVNFTALQQHIADGELPPMANVHIHRGRSHFPGVTVEFEASAVGTQQVRRCTPPWPFMEVLSHAHTCLLVSSEPGIYLFSHSQMRGLPGAGPFTWASHLAAATVGTAAK